MRLHGTCGGSITVDGVDLRSLPLRDLRRDVTFVPQVPFLFEGTVRRNLDPAGEYTVGEAREALDVVGLGEMGVEDGVESNGANLSVGQCQLLSLARAGSQRAFARADAKHRPPVRGGLFGARSASE